MTVDITRRRLLQAAGATVAAGYVTSEAGVAEATPAPAVVTYAVPDGIPQGSTFEVEVRAGGGRWTPVATYSVDLKLIDAQTGAGQLLKSSLAYFDFAGSVQVRVKY